jgi:hypothetical protein
MRELINKENTTHYRLCRHWFFLMLKILYFAAGDQTELRNKKKQIFFLCSRKLAKFVLERNCSPKRKF